MRSNPQAKRILCYGDSNTWGQNPHVKGGRFAVDERWTGVAQAELGDGYEIIEEGLSSRTTDLNYKGKSGRNGKIYFQPCLESQNPLDLVVIMLGTNDFKCTFGPRPVAEIAAALQAYTDDIKTFAYDAAGNPSRVALMSPIYIDMHAPYFSEWYFGTYDQQSADLSRALASALQEVAKSTGSFFFDAATVASPGEDGIHISREGHRALGEKMATSIMDWLR